MTHSHSQTGSAPHLAALLPLEPAMPALEPAMPNELQQTQAELAASKAQVKELELERRIANDAITKLKDEIEKLRIEGALPWALRKQLSGARSSGAPPTERQEENPKSKACVLS